MLNFLGFDTADLMPHGYCLRWNPPLLWTLVGADLTAILWIVMPAAPSAKQMESASRRLEEPAQYARSLIEASLGPLATISADVRLARPALEKNAAGNPLALAETVKRPGLCRPPINEPPPSR